MSSSDAIRARRDTPRARGSVESLSGALEEFDLADYVTQARADGRARLSGKMRAQACTLYERVLEFRADHTTIPRQLDDTLELACRALFSEWFLSQSRFPRYRAYTNMAVLNWYLGTNRRSSYQEIWKRCATAIDAMLHDVLAFEINSLAGLETRGTESFDRDAVHARVTQLEAISRPFDAPAPCPRNDRPPASWQGYLSDSGALALTYLTAFPLTGEHDEYMFIRTLHISECCFWGILTASLAAAESLKRDDPIVAARCLAVALPFAELLTPLIQTLKTMTGARFERFREATGAASALQSRTYQLMQIALTGVHPTTIDVVVGIEELSELRFYDQPWYVTLSDLAAPFYANADGRHLLLTQYFDRLSLELRKWRKVHRGIVRSYLAARPEGTGGTNGAEYLKHTVDTTIAGAARARRSETHCDVHYRQRRLAQGILWASTADLAHARPVLDADN